MITIVSAAAFVKGQPALWMKPSWKRIGSSSVSCKFRIVLYSISQIGKFVALELNIEHVLTSTNHSEARDRGGAQRKGVPYSTRWEMSCGRMVERTFTGHLFQVRLF
jgi:hypothetical protein